jgi:hypothetical protein
VQVGAESLEEPVRGRDHPVVASLALHHGQPPAGPSVTASSRPAGGSSGHAAPGWPAPAYHPRQVGTQPRHRRQAAGDRPRRQPRLPGRQPHHRPVTALISQEIEHIRRGHLHRVLPDHQEERLQVEGHRPQRVRPAPARHELQIPVHQPLTQPVTDLARPRHETHKTRKLLISTPSRHVTPEHRSDTDHPCIKRDRRDQRGVAICHALTVRDDQVPGFVAARGGRGDCPRCSAGARFGVLASPRQPLVLPASGRAGRRRRAGLWAPAPVVAANQSGGFGSALPAQRWPASRPDRGLRTVVCAEGTGATPKHQ